jgi:hypothetical protein
MLEAAISRLGARRWDFGSGYQPVFRSGSSRSNTVRISATKFECYSSKCDAGKDEMSKIKEDEENHRTEATVFTVDTLKRGNQQFAGSLTRPADPLSPDPGAG